MARSTCWAGVRFGALHLGAAGILLACMLSTPVASQEPLRQALRDGRTVFVEHPTGEGLAEQLASELESISQFELVSNRDEADLLGSIIYGSEGVEELGPGLFSWQESMRLVLVDIESHVVVWDETVTGGDAVKRLVGNLRERLTDSR